MQRLRPTADARVSAPLGWDEVPDCQPEAFTIDTMPARFASLGDLWQGLDKAVGSLERLLDLAASDEAAGLPDAPWPPQTLGHRRRANERAMHPALDRAETRTYHIA